MKKKLLILEDEKDIVELLEVFLGENFEIVAKSSTTEVKEETPDLILSDLSLEDGNPLPWLQKKFPNIPTVIYSGQHIQDPESYCVQNKVNKFFHKPINFSMLSSYLRSL
jgi:DNA-binding NtrC family response regulator